MLDGYLMNVYLQNRQQIQVLVRIGRLIGADMTGTFANIFQAYHDNPDTLPNPMGSDHLQQLCINLLPLCKDRVSVQQALLRYVDGVLAGSLQTGVERISWLADLDTQGQLLTPDLRMKKGFQYACSYLQTIRKPLPDKAFELLLQWIRGGGKELFNAAYEQPMAHALEQLEEPSTAQLQKLIPYLQGRGALSQASSPVPAAVQKEPMPIVEPE